MFTGHWGLTDSGFDPWPCRFNGVNKEARNPTSWGRSTSNLADREVEGGSALRRPAQPPSNAALSAAAEGPDAGARISWANGDLQEGKWIEVFLDPLVYPFLGEGSPTEIDYRKKGYPYSNLSTGGPSGWFLCPETARLWAIL